VRLWEVVRCKFLLSCNLTNTCVCVCMCVCIQVVCSEGNSGFYEVGCMVTPLEAGYSVLGWNHPGFWGSTVTCFHFSVVLLLMICLISMLLASHLASESGTPDLNSSPDLIHC